MSTFHIDPPALGLRAPQPVNRATCGERKIDSRAKGFWHCSGGRLLGGPYYRLDSSARALLDFPDAEMMLARIHVHQFAEELHTFQLEAIPLFRRGAGFQLYGPSRSNHPVPRQAIGRITPQQA